MNSIDTIIFGDNQFFGINHMSQEKAQQLAEKFYDISNIFTVYDIAYNAGIKAFMLNSNERAKEICSFFLDNKHKYSEMNWYPSIPYPHKYANIIGEKGIFPAINEILFKESSKRNAIGMIAKGGRAVFSKDAIQMMKMLIDIEMKIFRGLNLRVVFLQNIITDLMLGYGIKEIFFEYCEHIRNTYHASPGLITQNMPYLLQKLKEWDIKDVVVCSSINKIGYLMSPSITSYEQTIKSNNPDEYQIIAMSTMASGAIPAKKAYEYINKQNIQSVVFGASSKEHIEETVKLIKLS